MAPAESSPQYKWSVDQSVKGWTAKGFPASKIVLGVPFYGYVYNSVSGGGNGMYKKLFRREFGYIRQDTFLLSERRLHEISASRRKSSMAFQRFVLRLL
jgi:GH18 family chitinase